MNLILRLSFVCLLVSLLTACDAPTATPDPATATFVALSAQARQRAQKEIADAVLLQADTDLNKTIFRFTDKAGTQAIDVTVSASNQITSTVSTKSPLLGRAAIDMNIQELRLSPNRVAQAISQQYPDCKIRTLTLYRNENEKQLTWLAFCSTAQGMVIGEINDATGTLKPASLPPFSLPLTATPAR